VCSPTPSPGRSTHIGPTTLLEIGELRLLTDPNLRSALRVRVIVIRAGTGDSEMLLDALYPPE
jgi:hypothetical protein